MHALTTQSLGSVRNAAELTFLGIRILPLGTYLDIFVKLKPLENTKSSIYDHLLNVDAEKLLFTYVLILEISVKK